MLLSILYLHHTEFGLVIQNQKNDKMDKIPQSKWEVSHISKTDGANTQTHRHDITFDQFWLHFSPILRFGPFLYIWETSGIYLKTPILNQIVLFWRINWLSIHFLYIFCEIWVFHYFWPNFVNLDSFCHFWGISGCLRGTYIWKHIWNISKVTQN